MRMTPRRQLRDRSSPNEPEGFPRRARRQREPASSSVTLNFAPMIDVTFLLLIFFLVTTTFERPEGLLASDLPRDTGVPAVALPISPIVVRLTQTGPDHDDVRIGLDHFAEAPEDFEALPSFLRKIQEQPGFDDQTPVVIIADNDVRWDHVVSCWNAALRSGYKRIAFGEP